jgi:hypothetical protein
MNENLKNMRTINISISDMEYNHLGIKNENITFSEFTELVKREVLRNNLNNCVALAEKYGLSSMTMNEINKEIKSVIKAKNRH